MGTGVGLDEGCELGEGVGVDVGVLEGSVVGVQDGQGVGLNTGTGFPIACKALSGLARAQKTLATERDSGCRDQGGTRWSGWRGCTCPTEWVLC